MLFKKFWYISFISLLAFFQALSIQAFSPEEVTENKLPSRVIALAKNVMGGDEETFGSFLDLAKRGAEEDSRLKRLVEAQFPEARRPEEFKLLLENVWKKVDWKSNPIAKRFMPFLISFLLPESVRAHFNESEDKKSPAFDINAGDYWCFQIGQGILESYLRYTPERQRSAKAPLPEHHGHLTILNGLDNFTKISASDFNLLTSMIERSESSSHIHVAKALAQALYVFASECKGPTFYTVFDGAKMYASILVATKEWTPESKTRFFYDSVCPAMEAKIAGLAAYSLTQLTEIDKLKGGRDLYAKKTASLIDDYGYSYLTSYSDRGGYFSKDQRTMSNGTRDTNYIMRKVNDLYSLLINNVFADKSETERGTQLQSYLDESGILRDLKSCFNEDGVPNLNGPAWGELVFGWAKIDQLKADNPGLFL